MAQQENQDRDRSSTAALTFGGELLERAAGTCEAEPLPELSTSGFPMSKEFLPSSEHGLTIEGEPPVPDSADAAAEDEALFAGLFDEAPPEIVPAPDAEYDPESQTLVYRGGGQAPMHTPSQPHPIYADDCTYCVVQTTPPSPWDGSPTSEEVQDDP